MPLSPPVGRQHLHTRKVTCQGFYRDDGLFDIEGRITDEKTYEHANEWRGPLGPGDLVHDMSIRLTLDHRFTIVDVEAVTDSSPYRICGNIAPNFTVPMHRTLSLDYAVVISGEIVVKIDSGEEKTVKAGEFIVQGGVNHQWINKTDETCRIGFVTVGAEKIKLADGTVLDEIVVSN